MNNTSDTMLRSFMLELKWDIMMGCDHHDNDQNLTINIVNDNALVPVHQATPRHDAILALQSRTKNNDEIDHHNNVKSEHPRWGSHKRIRNGDKCPKKMSKIDSAPSPPARSRRFLVLSHDQDSTGRNLPDHNDSIQITKKKLMRRCDYESSSKKLENHSPQEEQQRILPYENMEMLDLLSPCDLGIEVGKIQECSCKIEKEKQLFVCSSGSGQLTIPTILSSPTSNNTPNDPGSRSNINTFEGYPVTTTSPSSRVIVPRSPKSAALSLASTNLSPHQVVIGDSRRGLCQGVVEPNYSPSTEELYPSNEVEKIIPSYSSCFMRDIDPVSLEDKAVNQQGNRLYEDKPHVVSGIYNILNCHEQARKVLH